MAAPLIKVPLEYRSGHIHIMEDNLLHAISKLQFMSSLKFFAYAKWHGAHSKHRDQQMCQAVAYKRLKKQWTIIELSARESGCGGLQGVVI